MANTINWGRIYCFTEFGDEDNTVAESIPSFSSPECFLVPRTSNIRETKAFTIDIITRFIDSAKLKIDNTEITLWEKI